MLRQMVNNKFFDPHLIPASGAMRIFPKRGLRGNLSYQCLPTCPEEVQNRDQLAYSFNVLAQALT